MEHKVRRIIRILKVNLPGHLKDKKFLAQKERKYGLTFNYVLGVNDDNRAKIQLHTPLEIQALFAHDNSI